MLDIILRLKEIRPQMWKGTIGTLAGFDVASDPAPCPASEGGCLETAHQAQPARAPAPKPQFSFYPGLQFDTSLGERGPETAFYQARGAGGRMKMLTKVCAAAILVVAAVVRAEAASPPPQDIAGAWLATLDVYGSVIYNRLDLEQKGSALTGTYGSGKVTGTVLGSAFKFIAVDPDGGTDAADGVIENGALKGVIIESEPDFPGHTETNTFTADLVPARPSTPPRRFDFAPTAFFRNFSALNAPVLTISPGDTVRTSTVDAGGADALGVKRILGGNPETGPFFVASALPGDTLVVHILKLKLNRDYAVSDDAIVERGLGSDLAVKMKDAGKTVVWRLDRVNGQAFLQTPGPHMAQFKVPVHPMLGCVATAPLAAQGTPGSGDSGYFGGNMDFSQVSEGATLYLPVSVPGALLYMGDGHAAQGDGELNGNALETSMDVEFSVDVIARRRITAPRVESATKIMAMGLGGSTDEALKRATANMAHWLEEDYKLTPAETAEVLGSAADYKVSEVADRNAGVVLSLEKALLAPLRQGGR